ncbi:MULTISPECIES: hypothetical protein [Leptolyngbya]|uniref:hypothetical protein n=1 Tax=Leptolyngbya TaxID=47251 RepID=UPI0016845CE8|nr:hypothetical protein [Leptolyngbya sp. FACHB-1624]MBD1855029.1 hypothetical protein [Leptolyngbya sp. FACHB-1624]
MKLFKIALFVAILLVNFAIASPSWADRPKATKNADYIEVTKTLDRLLQEQESDGATPALKQQIDELKIQKAAIASGITWGQCSNETGSTLAIYGSAPGESSKSADTLYFLADGQTTPDGWDCSGIYLPSGTKSAESDSTKPSVFKIMDGTRLVARRNSETGEIVFNAPLIADAPAEKMSIPNISQAFIDSRIPSSLSAEPLDD